MSDERAIAVERIEHMVEAADAIAEYVARGRAVFDADQADAHVIEWTGGYNLGRVQCPTCADRHRETA